MAKKRMVVVTTDKDKRGVFFGQLVKQGADTVILKDAQMAVYWSTETHGVLGLASIGPQSGSKITPVVPTIELLGVTSVMDATTAAIEQWRKEPWN